MLDKRGNSHTVERIALGERSINLFSKENIQALLGDREFVGQEWISYLNRSRIGYYLRIRNNFLIQDPRTGKQVVAARKFENLPLGEQRVINRKHLVNGQLCYLSASKVKKKEGKPELPIIISFQEPEKAKQIYKERWQIETAFKALKSSGFNIEDSHLTDIKTIWKIVIHCDDCLCLGVCGGIYIHQKIKKIRTLKHGYRAKSFVKYGLEAIEYVMLNPYAKTEYDGFEILSCS